MDPDHRFVAEAAAGSHDAFEQLVRLHHMRVYRLARSLTQGSADSEDLVQETFLRAFRAIGKFRGDSSFRTWLYQIAVNVIKTHLSRQARRDPLIEASARDDNHTLSPVETVASNEDVELDVARRQAVDRALATLSEELRILITLRDVEGLEYHEIAIVTGIPEGTVASRVFRARRHLRPILESFLGRRPVAVDS